MTTVLILLLCAALACLIVCYIEYRKLRRATDRLSEVENRTVSAQRNLDRLENTYWDRAKGIEDLVSEKEKVRHEIENAETQKAASIELAAKQLELEREKQLSEFNASLEEEKNQLLANSEVTKYKQELEEVNKELDAARQSIKVQQEQALNAAKAEDFVNFHSIELTQKDLKDIELIRDFAPQLTRQEAFFKLIWTEYIQKPIQALCKTVGAEKVSGIYKITNIESGRMYIGQAVDIAARWKEHCKCGLGIGTTGYLSNKFYKALHADGIENFTFEILELCPGGKLNEREIYWIDFYNGVPFGYNTKSGG